MPMGVRSPSPEPAMTTSATDPRPDWRWLIRHPAHLVAFGFGAGLAPRAPGTVGTLAGFVLFLAIEAAAPDLANRIALLIAAFLFGLWACARAGRSLGVADHPGIVIDEIVAFALVLVFTPGEGLWWFAAFVLFRLFDIAKPWPIRVVDQRMHHAFGVMFDDLLAAGYAIACLQLAAHRL